jgi:hypothetical protein
MTAMVTGGELADALLLPYDDETGDTVLDQVAAAADAIMESLLTVGDTIDHGTHAWCKEAALSIATELHQARTAVGGQPVALDFTPSPYRLSKWLTERVKGVVGQCWDVRGMIG